MRCEEVRELLPAYVDAEPHVPGDVEAHLASCESCRAELGSYREMIAALEALRDATEVPSPDLLERVLALAPESNLAARAMGSLRAHPVLVSAGAAAVGAAAVAAVWRRRRSATPAVS